MTLNARYARLIHTLHKSSDAITLFRKQSSIVSKYTMVASLDFLQMQPYYGNNLFVSNFAYLLNL